MKITDIIRKSVKASFYRKTASRTGGIVTNARGYLLSSSLPWKFRFHIDNTISTACWHFDSKSNEHNINIGSKLVDNIANTKTKNSDELKVSLYKEVIKHEIGHACFSCRDAYIVNQLKINSIPFDLYNLLEDCRIEFLTVNTFPRCGRFYWHRYVDVETESDKLEKPSDILYHLKKVEAYYRASNGKTKLTISRIKNMIKPKYNNTNVIYYENGTSKTMCTVNAVIRYYIRSCTLTNVITGDRIGYDKMISLLKDWIQSFGKDAPYQYSFDPTVNGNDESGNVNESTNKAPTSQKQKTVKSEITDLAKTNNKGDPRKVRSLIHKMTSLHNKAGFIKNKISTVGSKIIPFRAYSRQENCFKSNKVGKGKRKLLVMVDFSSSMSDTWNYNGGKEFICSLLHLNRSNIIDLKCYISVDNKFVDVTRYHPDEVMKIRPSGNRENLDTNLKKVLPLVKQYHTTLLFTDGLLTGNVINEAEYRKQGIDIIAACVPKENDTKEIRRAMNGYFTKSYLSNDIMTLAQRLTNHIIK